MRRDRVARGVQEPAAERIAAPPAGFPVIGRTSSPDAAHAMAALRIGLGIIWALNLLFILDPANDFFPTFAATAGSFGPSTLGGPSLPTFVADHPMIFAGFTAGTTAYLAFAFLSGWTTRIACLIGLVFNALLLATQYGQVVVIPGGTDVGPQPIYLLIYVTLLLAGPSSMWSLEAWVRSRSEHRRSVLTSSPS
jgi:uncharacterized membrane protein YphA (DoxX/SURF4 family)